MHHVRQQSHVAKSLDLLQHCDLCETRCKEWRESAYTPISTSNNSWILTMHALLAAGLLQQAERLCACPVYYTGHKHGYHPDIRPASPEYRVHTTWKVHTAISPRILLPATCLFFFFWHKRDDSLTALRMRLVFRRRWAWLHQQKTRSILLFQKKKKHGVNYRIVNFRSLYAQSEL
jgi:hypothetical protein